MADEPDDGLDLAGQRLDEALSQRKKEFQHMKNIIGRKVKQRNKEDRLRLALFKVICFPLILLCILTKQNCNIITGIL